MSLSTACLVFSGVGEVADGCRSASSIGGRGREGEFVVRDGKFIDEEPDGLIGAGIVVTGSIFLITISPPSWSAISVADRKSSISPRRRRAFPRSERLATGM
jgi:hypothetical protein